jgi:hypothetical protein
MLRLETHCVQRTHTAVASVFVATGVGGSLVEVVDDALPVRS